MSGRVLAAWALAALVPIAASGFPAEGPTLTMLQAGSESETRAAEPLEKSITVFPIQITPSLGQPPDFLERVGVVVGVFLEKAGLEKVEVSGKAFSGAETDKIEQVADEFGSAVADAPLTTNYALYAEIVHEDRKIRAIRTVIVDKQGNVVLAAEDTPETFADASDVLPKDPMSCCVFISRRVQKQWGLADPLRPDAPQGTLVERLKKEAGAPSDEELAAMRRRQEALKAELSRVKVTIYPVHVRGVTDKECAAQLAGTLSEQGICTCEAAEAGPALSVKGHYDEQKVLWDTARAFREYLRKNPPATEYAAYVDYAISPAPPGQAKVGHIHWILCDRAGDWVAVDYMNSHHADFQEVDPKSREDCNRLLVERVKRYTSAD